MSWNFQIFNWLPDYYKSTEELPEDMPKGLREHIEMVSKTKPEKVNFLYTIFLYNLINSSCSAAKHDLGYLRWRIV
jgi:hypothetical protein